MRSSTSLARLIRSLRLSKRQLSLPPRELEAVLLERLRRRAAKRLPPSRLSCVVTAEELALLDADPEFKAAGEIARAKLEQMIDEGCIPLGRNGGR